MTLTLEKRTGLLGTIENYAIDVSLSLWKASLEHTLYIDILH